MTMINSMTSNMIMRHISTHLIILVSQIISQQTNCDLHPQSLGHEIHQKLSSIFEKNKNYQFSLTFSSEQIACTTDCSLYNMCCVVMYVSCFTHVHGHVASAYARSKQPHSGHYIPRGFVYISFACLDLKLYAWIQRSKIMIDLIFMPLQS